ncbi:hypothetical protein BZA77DRAFT_54718 [Pyronema omphalodes]|nr:hypothetical protein BZA77DRAFT_54718 [Pyronema omphalodes]
MEMGDGGGEKTPLVAAFDLSPPPPSPSSLARSTSTPPTLPLGDTPRCRLVVSLRLRTPSPSSPLSPHSPAKEGCPLIHHRSKAAHTGTPPTPLSPPPCHSLATTTPPPSLPTALTPFCPLQPITGNIFPPPPCQGLLLSFWAAILCWAPLISPQLRAAWAFRNVVCMW